MGIGTTNPQEKLHVNGNLVVSGTDNRIGGATYLVPLAVKTDEYGCGIYVQHSGGSGFMNLGMEDPNYAQIEVVKATGTSWGNLILNPYGGSIGIGTTSPQATLDVNGNALVRGDYLRIGHGSPRAYIYADTDYMVFTLPGGNKEFHFKDKDGNVKVAISSTGNVGIGTTSPGGRLDLGQVSDRPVIKWNASGGREYGIEPYDNRFILADLGVRRILEADPAGWTTLWGNVGIDVNDPQAKLHVKGNIIADDPIASNHVVTKGYADANYKDPPGKWNCTIRSGSAKGGGFVSAIASCVGSEKVISGGCKIDDSEYSYNYLLESRPTDQGWKCRAYHHYSDSILIAYANCCQ